MKERFAELWSRIRAKGDFKEEFRKLTLAYTGENRFYHNLFHISDGLEEISLVRELADFSNALEFAWFYHDFVYDSKAKNNEDKSAEACKEVCLRAGLPEEFIGKTDRLIIATKHIVAPSGNDEKLIVDVDLSILGKPKEIFDEYERSIRKEYSFVGEEDFRAGRKKILEGFLKRDSIYFTEFFRSKYELKAIENLKRSISRLS